MFLSLFHFLSKINERKIKNEEKDKRIFSPKKGKRRPVGGPYSTPVPVAGASILYSQLLAPSLWERTSAID